MILSTPALVVIAAAVLAAGFMISAVSIGGGGIIPILAFPSDTDVHMAIAWILFSTIFTGALAAFMYARTSAIDWPAANWPTVGAMTGAYLGSLVQMQLSGGVVEALFGAMVLVTGINAVLAQPSPSGPPDTASHSCHWFHCRLRFRALRCRRTTSSCPHAMWMNVPILTVVGLGQVFQIPVSLFTTLRNWISVIVDFRLGKLIAACLLVGVYFGVRYSARVNAKRVKHFTALVLIGIALLLFARLVL